MIFKSILSMIIVTVVCFSESNINDFAIYSKTKTDLQHRSNIKGDIGSFGAMSTGCDDTILGHLSSGENILIRDRSMISGNITSNGSISALTGVLVKGTKIENASIAFPDLPTITVTPGTQNITIPSDASYTLYPGSYNDFQAFYRTTITIKPGTYAFNKFLIESDVKIIVEAGNGSTNINVKDFLKIGDRVDMRFADNKIYPYSVNFYSAQTSPLMLGYDNTVYGVVIAPNAEIRLASRSKQYGALFGKSIVVESEGFICKPPSLDNLTHSEYVIAPPFNPSCLSYNFVLPTTKNTLSVYPIGSNGQVITVDGQSPGSLINLNGTQQKIIVLLSDPSYCGSTEYILNVTRSNQYQIFVNANSPCAPGLEDGKSWATAYKDLQRAMDSAAVQGKELWIGEGTYTPTKRTNANDPRSATFICQSGTKIVGGFLGTETTNEPEGDSRKTILSGDLANNDSLITAWPPKNMSLLSDNVYHVITITNPIPTDMVSIENITIEGGYADDSGCGKGAGILNQNCNPIIKECNIQNNIALSSGAGYYDNGNSDFDDCLFKNNVSISGSGSGLYINGNADTSKLNAVVFDNNICQDTTTGNGGALANARANVSIKSSVFTRNSSSSNGGAILTKGGTLTIDNCTVAYNSSAKDGVGITSYNSAVDACNSIFWNPGAVAELLGSNYTLSYSDIRGSYAGDGNIADDPLFKNSALPDGPDGIYGSKDDGLQLSSGSPCKQSGTNDRMPEYDIRLIPLSYDETVCRGAYEYEEYGHNQVQRGPLGYLLKTGEFEPISKTDIIDVIYNWKEAGIYAHSNYARVLQVVLPKNKYTHKTDMFVMTVRGINAIGQPLSASIGVQIPLVRVGSFGNNYYYQSKTLTWGKSILFCADPDLQNWNDSAYIVYTKSYGVSYNIPKSYFHK